MESQGEGRKHTFCEIVYGQGKRVVPPQGEIRYHELPEGRDSGRCGPNAHLHLSNEALIQFCWACPDLGDQGQLLWMVAMLAAERVDTSLCGPLVLSTAYVRVYMYDTP